MKSDWEGAGGALVVGRFAPSPSGPLHFGSIVAAVGSYLSARHGGGRWLLRIEDVDVPRSVPGAADGILRTLERFGFEWDGPVVWQSARTPAYDEAFARLRANGQVFGCACTRKEMADSMLARDGTRRYPGTCRTGLPPGPEPVAVSPTTKISGWPGTDRSGSTMTRPARSAATPSQRAAGEASTPAAHRIVPASITLSPMLTALAVIAVTAVPRRTSTPRRSRARRA